MALSGQDIVCVGFSDWNNTILTNEQHLLTRMAGDNTILFVESLGLRRPQVAGRDLKRIARRLWRGVQPPRAVDGLHVLSPLVLPLHDVAAARRFNAYVLPWLVRRAARKLGMRTPILWSFVGQAEVLIDPLQPSKVLFYNDDDHGAKKGIDAESFYAAEAKFAARADAILCSAPEITARMRALNDHVYDAPNVADTAMFATALADGPVDPALAALPGPRIVFVGAIQAHTVDVPLVVELATARPDWSLAFVGPVGTGDPGTDVSAMAELPNVHLLGPRRYTELPDVLRGADAAMLPYLTGGAMRSVFPMKTYEYLAAGRPVVTTPLPALADVPDVARAATGAEFAARLQEVMDADTPQERKRRSDAVQSHSFEARIEQIGAVLGA
ncbi:MAG: glycosyltransferase family 1 protein [Conexibacter sp.]|nr:glycosyltransferase family 1 protein [Conexibacter sp.]